nr:eukaryotic translation initiation factor 3 subunit I-like isoform X4 [Ipomoea batatas]
MRLLSQLLIIVLESLRPNSLTRFFKKKSVVSKDTLDLLMPWPSILMEKVFQVVAKTGM